MGKLPIRSMGALLGAVMCAAAWQQNVNTSSWSGVIINGGCTSDEAFAESDKCFERSGSSARLALYDDTVRQVYDLDAQKEAQHYFGDSVTVEGTLQDKSIRVSSIRKLTSIGRPTGGQAPAFSLRDQFGRWRGLGTLKASRGTVLLFFRSADW